MKMKHAEALNILGLSKGVDIDGIKRAYRVACAQYHPDRNPAGLEMMKLVNAAYQALSDYVPSESIEVDLEEDINLGDELNVALNAIIGLGLNIEICGTWIWVSGETKPHRDILKNAGYRWAPKKMMWSYCGGKRTTSRGKYSMDDIRNRHGSINIKPTHFHKLSA